MTDWKIWEIFDTVNVMCLKFYKTFGNLMRGFYFSKGKLHSSHISQRKTNISELKFANCDTYGYIYDMEVYLGKDRKQATIDMTRTHATGKQLSRKVKGCGHKLCMDNNYSSPDLYSDLTEEKINY